MRVVPIVVVLTGLVSVACSHSDTATNELASSAEPILYGSPETEHDAVVSIGAKHGSSWGMCTGTIIEVRGTNGYVLTAAHCVVDGSGVMTPSRLFVLAGTDYTSPTKTYTVAEVAIHPMYDVYNDFAMIRFTGASASTPSIPALAPEHDDLARGVAMELVGYGRTEVGDNTVRNHITKRIAAIDPVTLIYDQRGVTGGLCFGDSGGPSLTTQGPLRVGGVSSAVAGEECRDLSYAGRVSSVYDSFIVPFIEGRTGVFSCDECWYSAAASQRSQCHSKISDCLNSSECMDLVTCVDSCWTGDCWYGCVDEYPEGATIYRAIDKCKCDSCSAQCSSDARCTAPACGLGHKDAACEQCSSTRCCWYENECSKDSECAECNNAQPPESCLDTHTFADYGDCLETNCHEECGMKQDACRIVMHNDDCQSCIENSCCDIARNCAINETCSACARSASPPEPCNDSLFYDAFAACTNENCSEQCAWPAEAVDGGPATETSKKTDANDGCSCATIGRSTNETRPTANTYLLAALSLLGFRRFRRSG